MEFLLDERRCLAEIVWSEKNFSLEGNNSEREKETIAEEDTDTSVRSGSTDPIGRESRSGHHIQK